MAICFIGITADTPNHRDQILNNFKIPISNDQNISITYQILGVHSGLNHALPFADGNLYLLNPIALSIQMKIKTICWIPPGEMVSH